MLSFFRRTSKSTVGTIIMALMLLAIIAGFAIADAQNFGSGSLSFGGDSALATAGGERVTDSDMSDAMQRRLSQVRQQNPTADYGTIAAEFEPILSALIDERALVAFANAHGFRLSKRLVDAEIAQIPATKGLNGQFSETAYQGFLAQQRMTDAQLRRLLSSSLLQRLILAPVVANPRVPVGLATPYANMMLEAREGAGESASKSEGSKLAELIKNNIGVYSFRDFFVNRCFYVVLKYCGKNKCCRQQENDQSSQNYRSPFKCFFHKIQFWS